METDVGTENVDVWMLERQQKCMVMRVKEMMAKKRKVMMDVTVKLLKKLMMVSLIYNKLMTENIDDRNQWKKHTYKICWWQKILTTETSGRNVPIKYIDDRKYWWQKLVEGMYSLNMLMTENIDNRNFIPTIYIADNVPTMQSGKRRTFTVTTHGIPKQKP